jgi:hypothetical protein
VEGQNDLRRTSLAGAHGSPAGSYRGNAYSIAPFSYRVFRATSLVSSEACDLAFMLRERFLSWQELLGRWEEGGSFFVFQRDSHSEDLTVGFLSNTVVQNLRGVTDVSPFANDQDTLSVLDRRFWLQDNQLDFTYAPGGFVPYTLFYMGEGRPVFPEYIEEVLGKTDNLRDFRAVWLDYRVNLVTGTKAALRRYAAQEPQRVLDQRKLIRFRGR